MVGEGGGVESGKAKARQPHEMLVVQGELAKFAIITNNICVINSQPNIEGFGWALM
jgi:hypothetical protein